jgi:hypothetical protein
MAQTSLAKPSASSKKKGSVNTENTKQDVSTRMVLSKPLSPLNFTP